MTEQDFLFPPYTGGCIARIVNCTPFSGVSSLYGRVYRAVFAMDFAIFSFLPIREGVSLVYTPNTNALTFPPYTGGCIAGEIKSAGH